MWCVSKDRISSPLLFSSLLNSGLHFHLFLGAGHFSSFTDPFSVSPISALDSTCHCLSDVGDINSSCFGTPYTFLYPLPVRVIIFLPCHFLLTISFSVSFHHSTASPITSATFLLFSSVSSISSAQYVSVSPLSDTEMMQKDKTI